MSKHFRKIWIAFLLFSAWSGYGQDYDKTWVIGGPMTSIIFHQDTIIEDGLPDTTLRSFQTIGNICDKNGKLLFYTNGVSVYNIKGKIMVNGDSLSAPSEYYNGVVNGGMPSRQGILILPKPGDTTLYYIFHYTPTDTFLNVGGYEVLNLYYSIVDMKGDSGNGSIPEKNRSLIQNEVLSFSRLAACRHSNGRDWWIIKNAWHTNVYYKFLLTPNGIQGPFVQQVGPMYELINEQGAYSQFSPDGSRYVSFTIESKVVLMDFDRCTGLFSNPDSIFNNLDFYSTNQIGALGCAFSPNGRFLYITDRLELNQYDLWSQRINDSVRIKTLLDSSDFYQMNILQLAPNGKIYISCYNGGSYKLHVINQPDSFGLACNFQLYGQHVGTPNPIAIPYFPNYKLGALAGVCDTITTLTSDIAAAHPYFAQIAPNPASDHSVLFYYTGTNAANQATIYDMTGRLVWSADIRGAHGTMDIDVSHLSAGMYTVTFTADGSTLLNTKLVVAR